MSDISNELASDNDSFVSDDILREKDHEANDDFVEDSSSRDDSLSHVTDVLQGILEQQLATNKVSITLPLIFSVYFAIFMLPSILIPQMYT